MHRYLVIGYMRQHATSGFGPTLTSEGKTGGILEAASWAIRTGLCPTPAAKLHAVGVFKTTAWTVNWPWSSMCVRLTDSCHRAGASHVPLDYV